SSDLAKFAANGDFHARRQNDQSSAAGPSNGSQPMTIDRRGSVHSNKSSTSELRRKGCDRSAQQIGSVARVKPDVFALRFDPIHVGDVEADKLAPMTDPECPFRLDFPHPPQFVQLT